MPTNPTNNQYKPRNILGKQFSQEALKLDLQAVIAGQIILIRVVLFIFVILLTILAGILAGFLGGVVSYNIAYPYQGTWLSYSGMSLGVIIWVTESLLHSFNRGLVYASLTYLMVTAVIATLSELGWITASFAPQASLILSFLSMAVATLSIFTEGFALALTSVLLNKNRKIFRKIFVSITIVFSIFSAYGLFSSGIFDNPQTKALRVEASLPAHLPYAVVVGGFVFGYGVAIASLLATRFEDKRRQHLNFFRYWAIAIGSWGGTSFYNLDLSGVNFRNAKLANTDLRARKLYRTCLQDVTGLEKARVDSRYLDLENPKVQRLLTHGDSEDKNFSQLNLRGAYLQKADLRHFNFINTDLTGADLQGTDLRGSILVRAQVIGVDFTEANLTGICVEDWSVNSQTCFTEVQCDYIYRKLDEKGELTDRYPIDRNFEPREFESLYQEVGNVVELIFKEGVNWRAFSFSLQKLQIEDNGLGLELKGFEKRGDRWVVKVTHNESVPRQEVEQRVYGMYDEMKNLLVAKEQQINKLLGIAADQAEALKSYSKQPFGNSFFIVGSTITNLAGSGQIDYDEAAGQVRNIVANGSAPAQVTTFAQNLLHQLQGQSIATTSDKQAELIQQVILNEAQKDPIFQQFFVQQGQQISSAMPEGAIASAIQNAIAQLS